MSQVTPSLYSPALSLAFGSIKGQQAYNGKRKLGDHTYLSWNNPPANKAPSTGIATGREARPGEPSLA